jgi:proline-specific peptidase
MFPSLSDMDSDLPADQPAPRHGYLPAGRARLYYREIGHGPPVIVLHGGPDFDHNYLLPELDRLADSFRLIYYDQRGRGSSGEHVQPEDVTLESELQDVDLVLDYFRLPAAVLLGHSWGCLLAMEYATRHPHRVSHLALLNSAPASHADRLFFLQERRRKSAADIEAKQAIAATPSYRSGDLAADAEYYRAHFRATIRDPDQLERVVRRLRVAFTPEGVRKARAIEQRLYNQTYDLGEYDLLPRLSRLRIPARVLHGEHDFIPLECAAHIAAAIPGARLIELSDCGHFSFLECPEQVRREVQALFARD